MPLQVVVNSNPLTYRDVGVGEYGNQPAVDRFTANVRYFQGQPPIAGDPGAYAVDTGDERHGDGGRAVGARGGGARAVRVLHVAGAVMAGSRIR